MSQSMSNDQQQMHKAQLKLMLMSNNMHESPMSNHKSPPPPHSLQYRNISPLSIHNQERTSPSILQQVDNSNIMHQQQPGNYHIQYPQNKSHSQFNPQIFRQQQLQQIQNQTISTDNFPSRQYLQYQLQNSNFSTIGKNTFEKNLFASESILGPSKSPSPNTIYIEEDNQTQVQHGYQQRIAQVLQGQQQITRQSNDQQPFLSDAKSSTNNLRTSYKQFVTHSATPSKPASIPNFKNILSDLTMGEYSSQNQSQSNGKGFNGLKNTNQFNDYNEAIKKLKKKRDDLTNAQKGSVKQNEFTFANNTDKTTTPTLHESNDYNKRYVHQESLPLLNQFIKKPVIKLTQNGVQSFHNIEEMEQTLSYKSKLKISQPYQVQILKHILDSQEDSKNSRQEAFKNEQKLNSINGGQSPYSQLYNGSMSKIGQQIPQLSIPNNNTSLPNLSNQKISSQSNSITIDQRNGNNAEQLSDLSLENIQKIAMKKYLQDLSLSDLEQIVKNNYANSQIIQNATSTNNDASSQSIQNVWNQENARSAGKSQQRLRIIPPVPIQQNNQTNESPFGSHIKSSILSEQDDKYKQLQDYQISQQFKIKEKTKFDVPPRQAQVPRPYNNLHQQLPLAPKASQSKQKNRSIDNLEFKIYNKGISKDYYSPSNPQQQPLTTMMLNQIIKYESDGNITPEKQKVKVFTFPNDPSELSKMKDYSKDAIFVQNQNEILIDQQQRNYGEEKIGESKQYALQKLSKNDISNFLKQNGLASIDYDREAFFQQMNQAPISNNDIVTSNSLCTSIGLKTPNLKTPGEVNQPPLILSNSQLISPHVRSSNNFKNQFEQVATNLNQPPSISDLLIAQQFENLAMPPFDSNSLHIVGSDGGFNATNLNQDSSNFGGEQTGNLDLLQPRNLKVSESQDSVNIEEMEISKNLVQKKREITLLRDIRDMLQQMNSFREMNSSKEAIPENRKSNAQVQCNMPNDIAIQTEAVQPNFGIPLNDPQEFLKFIKENLLELKIDSNIQSSAANLNQEEFRRNSLNIPKSVKNLISQSYHKLLSQNSQQVQVQSDQQDEFFNSKTDIKPSIIDKINQDLKNNRDPLEKYVSPKNNSSRNRNLLNSAMVKIEELDHFGSNTNKKKQSSHQSLLQVFKSNDELKLINQRRGSHEIQNIKSSDSSKIEIKNQGSQRRSSLRQSKPASAAAGSEMIASENRNTHHVHFDEKPQKEEIQKQKTAKYSEFSEGKKSAISKHSKKTEADKKSSISKKQTIIILAKPVTPSQSQAGQLSIDRKQTLKINMSNIDNKVQQGIKQMFQKSPIMSRQPTHLNQGFGGMTRQGTTLSIARQGTTFKLQEVAASEPETLVTQKTLVQVHEALPKEKRKVNNKLNFAQNLLFKIAPNKKDKKLTDENHQLSEIVEQQEEQKNNVPEPPKGRRRYFDYNKIEGAPSPDLSVAITPNELPSPTNRSSQLMQQVLVNKKNSPEQKNENESQKYQFSLKKSYADFAKAKSKQHSRQEEIQLSSSIGNNLQTSSSNRGSEANKEQTTSQKRQIKVPRLKLPLQKAYNDSYEESSSSSNEEQRVPNKSNQQTHKTLGHQSQKPEQSIFQPNVNQLKIVQESQDEDTSGTMNNNSNTQNSTQQEFNKMKFVQQKSIIQKISKQSSESIGTPSLGNKTVPFQKFSTSSILSHKKAADVFSSKIRQMPMLKASSSSMQRFGKYM